jgi:hypothetical protein
VPFLLRRSDDKRRWDAPSWLPAGESPAAPFKDLSTTHASQLSVWSIDDERSNLNRIVAALAASRDHIDKFDYFLIDERDAAGLRIEIETRAERCADEEASRLWHRNMLKLTASQLHGLVRSAYATPRTGRILEPIVESMLRAGIGSSQLQRALVNSTLLQSLGL